MHMTLAYARLPLVLLALVYGGMAHARFVSVDPAPPSASTGQNFNRYWYADNNPYKYVDPDGRRIVFAHGSSDTFKTQFGEIRQQLDQHGMDGVFQRLDARPEVITIQESTRPHYMGFNTRTRTITLDPLSGVEVAPGRVQTPALGVLHEGGHAEAHFNDPQGELADYLTPDADYSNAAERKVIQDVETPAAEAMGEPTRTNHGGTPVRVQCPTCME